MKGQNQAATKQKNKNLILKLIITKAPISRIELSQITGLSKMAVTNIVGELIEEGIIHEVGLIDTSVGRKPIHLEVVDNSRHIVGVYISRDNVCCVCGDLKGTILEKQKKALKDETNKSLIKKITAMIDKFIKKYDNIIGIGIACIGPLNITDSIILNPPNFYEVKNLDIVAQLKRKFDVPIFLDNDMNSSALAEKYFGKAKLIDNFAYVGVTNGIGAGVFTNGTLYYGDCGFSGEIGHITVDINGRRCSCGNIGCLEMYASFSEKNKGMPKSERAKMLEEKCRYLAVGLVTLINLFDPKVIYIGHNISVFGKEAEEMLNKQLADRYISSGYKNIRVEQSMFGTDAPLYGSIALCIDKLFL